jgi:hypothetical protein
MVDPITQLANRGGDAPIAVAALVAFEHSSDAVFQLLVFVTRLQRLSLVVEGAARQACYLQQSGDGLLLP